MDNLRSQTVKLADERTIVGRLMPGTDLIRGIAKICNDNHVDYGAIVTAFGSLKQASIVYAVPDQSNKIGIRYCEPTIVDGPLELLACQGMIGLTPEKRINIHLHGVMSDPHMKMYGGHFIEEGNIVLATVEIVILHTPEVHIIKELDDETQFPLFKFYRKNEA